MKFEMLTFGRTKDPGTSLTFNGNCFQGIWKGRCRWDVHWWYNLNVALRVKTDRYDVFIIHFFVKNCFINLINIKHRKVELF